MVAIVDRAIRRRAAVRHPARPRVWVPPASGTITDPSSIVDTWTQAGRVHTVLFQAATATPQSEDGASRVYPIKDVLGRTLAETNPVGGVIPVHASLRWGILPVGGAIWPADIWCALILMDASDIADAGTDGIGGGIRAHTTGHKGRYTTLTAGVGGDTLTSTYRATVTDAEGVVGVPGITMSRRLSTTEGSAQHTIQLVNTDTGRQQVGSSTDEVASNTLIPSPWTHAAIALGRPGGTGSATAEFSFVPFLEYIPPDILGARVSG